MILICISIILGAIVQFSLGRELRKQQETIDAMATILLEVIQKLGIEKLETVERVEIRRE